MKHIVIIRLSTISEVAIAAPLIRAYALANPDIRFTMFSLKLMSPLFEGISNLFYCPEEIEEGQSDIFQAIKLSRKVLSLRPTDIADYSSTVLSHRICSICSFMGVHTSSVKDPLKFSPGIAHIQQRFENVLTSLGLSNLHFTAHPIPQKQTIKYTFHRIGVAPFAKYEGKRWPIDKMEKVVSELANNQDNHIYLFGDNNEEARILQNWEFKYSNCESVAGKYILKEELDLIKSLDLMITMDCANMHFASFVQTPVISIWGATSPALGFYGYGQDLDNAIGANIDCRPCSLFGDKKCKRGDYMCMKMITPEMVLDKINIFFEKDKNDNIWV